ncbi:hypothetical protein AGMMS49983_05870 [Clostridia bacterium]|nr:hypothetical protein AGMMS49983_05870 [Clostridia bacterium]
MIQDVKKIVKVPGLHTNLEPKDGQTEARLIRETLQRLLCLDTFPEISEDGFYRIALPPGWTFGHPENDFRRGLIHPEGYFLVSVLDSGMYSKTNFILRYDAVLMHKKSFRTTVDLHDNKDTDETQLGGEEVMYVILDQKTKRGSPKMMSATQHSKFVLLSDKAGLHAQKDAVEKLADEINHDWFASWEL